MGATSLPLSVMLLCSAICDSNLILDEDSSLQQILFQRFNYNLSTPEDYRSVIEIKFVATNFIPMLQLHSQYV